MGLKDVFGRMKPKSDTKKNAARNAVDDAADRAEDDDEEARRQTNEETIQVDVKRRSAPPSGQDDATMLAPPSRVEQERPIEQERPAPLHRPMPKARPSAKAAQASPAPAATPPRVRAAPHDHEATVIAKSSAAPAVQKSPASPFAPKVKGSPSTTPIPPKPHATPHATPGAAEPPTEATGEAGAASPAAVTSDDATVYTNPSEDTALTAVGVLVALFGETKGQAFAVPSGEITLGRGDTCHLQILDAKISREHAAITSGDGRSEIRALVDRNPIAINDVPITGPTALNDGDKLQFGNSGASIFRFRTIEGL